MATSTKTPRRVAPPQVNKAKARSAPAASRVTASRVAPNRVTAKAKARTAASLTENESLTDLLLTPPATMEDYLARIRALGERIGGCVEFMCGIEQFNGTCVDNKRRSVAQFYDRLVFLDRELCRIRE